jgi:DNA-binding transcriptional regulator YiaG
MARRETEQAKTLRAAKETLGVTSAGLAELLGVSEITIGNWLLPHTSNRHREMPLTAKLLLDRILADHNTKKIK